MKSFKESEKELVDEFFKKFGDVWDYTDEMEKFWLDKVVESNIRLLTLLEEKVKGMKEEKRYPKQAPLFQGCLSCGQEINRLWVDETCKEIRTDAYSDVLSTIEELKK